MSNFAHPEVLISSEWVGMDCCNALRFSLAEDLADAADRQSACAGNEAPDEAELIALLDAVLPTLRTWAAPPVASVSSRRAA